MKSRTHHAAKLFAVILSFGIPAGASADQPVIADTQAAAHVGQVATVEGLVANVFMSSKGNVFLNFEQPYPNEVFSGVIFSSSTAQFGDLSVYQGKRVRINRANKAVQR